mgnify:CR=1 FL=1
MRRLLLAAVMCAALSGPVLAVNPDEQLSDPALEARAKTLSRELRCVVCQNVSIDESDAALARDLRVILRERIAAGDTDEQAVAYLVQRYGKPVVIMETSTGWTVDNADATGNVFDAEQARHLTIYGALQNEDGTYSWKFDNHARWGGGVGGLSHAEQHHLWSRITCPVLLVRGTESWASDPVADGRIQHFQNAKLANFEGAGHWVHHDQLEAFMAETEAFLAE